MQYNDILKVAGNENMVHLAYGFTSEFQLDDKFTILALSISRTGAGHFLDSYCKDKRQMCLRAVKTIPKLSHILAAHCFSGSHGYYSLSQP